MRRFVTAVPAVIATVVAVLTVSTGSALAHDKGGGNHGKASHSVAGKAEHSAADKAEHGKTDKDRKVRPLLTLTGVVVDPTTVSLGSGSDTATSTITLVTKRGARDGHARTVVLTVDTSTVVRRGDAVVTAADLRPGDRVTARVRRMPDGSLLALRLRARPAHSHRPSPSPSPVPGVV